MKTLIIASGNTGCTVEVANKVSLLLGDADVLDTNSVSEFDFNKYDCFVFGANVRISKLNSRFNKWAKKLTKYTHDKKVVGYFVGADGSQDSLIRLQSKFKDALPNIKSIHYVGGEFRVDNLKGIMKKLTLSIIDEKYIKTNLPLPTINDIAIEEIVKSIQN